MCVWQNSGEMELEIRVARSAQQNHRLGNAARVVIQLETHSHGSQENLLGNWKPPFFFSFTGKASICVFNAVLFEHHCLAWKWECFPTELVTQNWTWLCWRKVTFWLLHKDKLSQCFFIEGVMSLPFCHSWRKCHVDVGEQGSAYSAVSHDRPAKMPL